MADFRATLYQHYVSTFKSASPPMSPEGMRLYFNWCAHMYLPRLAGIPRNARILELGCGPGHMLAFLKNQGFLDARGIDVAPEQVRIATSSGLDATVADVFEELACARASYAAIIAVDFLEHFTKDELVRLAPLLGGALQPGGRLLAQTANGAGLFPGQVVYGDLTHMTVLTPGSFAQMLRPFGFGDFHFYETGPTPIGLRGRVDVLLWRAIAAGATLLRRIETGKTQSIWTENFIASAIRLP